ncbi:autotransporter-associated beta strand repeat-containing protein [Luteolibacter ambystomatis]|uniref:Autotransporter-associated beta strand repeat-containing protein n=1 Tax=Luteolibacter ambystomatis TaxID=2824561 RepID=A0A975PER6_9BACT|nr:autotransporter-associated beta strand repeat-containing protein [Luteolibacter ambystomatis]QUE51609.1 autotransporter-associated beta strand repeat-containing protein [Luteolibacter ambystomatis]
MAICLAANAGATDYQWNGTTDSLWTTTTNWSAAGVPSYGSTLTADRLQIYNATKPAVYDPVADGAGSATTTFGGAAAGGGTSGRGLVIGNSGLGDGALTVNSGTLKIGGTASPLMSNAQNGTLIINGGLLDTISSGGANFITLFGGSNSVTCNVTLNGGEMRVKNFELNGGNAGASSVSNLTLNGGIFTVNGFIRTNATGSSTMTFAGGTLKAGASSSSFFNNLANTTLVVNSAGGTIDTNGFDITIAKAITAGTGAGGLTKNGIATLTLSGANTYTGGTTVNRGFLTFANASAVPASGIITLNAAGSLTASGAQTTVQGWISSGKIATTSTGAIALTASSAENIDFTGYNSLGLSSTAAATYSGSITPGSSGYHFGGGISTVLTVSTVLADVSGATGLTKSGFGSVTLTGANTYTGGTVIDGGYLAFDSGAVPATALIAVNAGASLVATGAQTTVMGWLASGRVAASSAGNIALKSASSEAIDFTGFNSLGLSASGAVTFSGTIIPSMGGYFFGGDTGNSLTLSSALGGGNVPVTKSGAGTLVFASAAPNTYTGLTTISAGNLSVTAPDGVVAIAGNVLVNGTGVLSTDSSKNNRIASTATVTVDGASAQFQIGANGSNTLNVLAVNNSGTVSIGTGTAALRPDGGITSAGGGSITGTASQAALDFNGGLRTITVTSGRLDIGTGISNGTLAKNGAGVLALYGANTYTGGTNLNSGTLGAFSSGALGTSGVISFNGGTLQHGSGVATDFSSRFSNADGQQYRIDTNGQAIIYATALTSNGGTVMKSGGGTLTLSGANTYTGGTTVTAGILAAGNMSAFGTAPINLNGGQLDPGNLTLANHVVLGGGGITGTGILGGVISETGGSQGLVSTGAVTLAGANTFTGGVTVASGTLTIANAQAMGAAGGTNAVTTDGAVLALSGNITVSGENITLTGTANSRGALQSSSGNNTFAGNITIANAATRIGSQDGADLTVSGTITGSGPNSSMVFRPGAGRVVTVSGAGNTWAGSTSTFGGTFKNGVNNAVPAGSVMSMGFGGVLTTDNTWDLNGFSQTVAGLANLNGIQTAGLNIITNNGGVDSVLTLNGTTDRSFTGILTDGTAHKLALVKNGTFKQTLTGSSTHTGGTTIHAGTLSLTSPSSLADSSTVGIDATGATLDLAFTGTETVGQLFIGGVQMASGTWGGTGSGAANIDSRFSGTGTLTVISGPVGGGYDTWAAGKGLTGVNNGKSQDPDGDGVINFTEYAFDGDPLSGGRVGKRITKVATVGSENVLTLTFPVRTTASFMGGSSASGDGVTYTVQASVDLSIWNQIPVSETPTTGAGGLPTLSPGYSYRTFYVPGSDPALNPKLFMRAIITETP